MYRKFLGEYCLTKLRWCDEEEPCYIGENEYGYYVNLIGYDQEFNVEDFEYFKPFSFTFDEYQAKAKETAVYPIDTRIFYPALGLAGEVGEVCNLIKKIYRDDNGALFEERKAKLLDEISDTFWYLASLCTDLGFSMSDIAKYNIEKLQNRKQKGTLHGSGNR